MVVLVTTYLLLVFLVPVVLSVLVSFRSLPRVTACPHCTRDTALLRARGGRPGRALLRAFRLQRRWCFHCGWTGFARQLPAGSRRGPSPGALTSPADPSQVLDLRSLRLDGRNWRVQLQCWQDLRGCYGRLVFIDGNGRPWPDATPAFTARTQLEVLGQALSIPDRTLASRLRQVITAD